MRIEGTFEGDINMRGLLVIGETGRVTCQALRANTVIVAGAVKGDITAERLEIRSTGKVWGNVVTVSFSTEDGAFLRAATERHLAKVTDCPEANELLRRSYRAGWTLNG